jgi:photosystem II stability/assembly factor-like uncharacterized protein
MLLLSMKNKKDTKKTVSLAIAALTSLLVAVIPSLATTPQQTHALTPDTNGAIDPGAGVAKGKTNQLLQQDDLGNRAQPSPSSPIIPTVGCAMDTIESLESFLTCLGAK